MTERPKVHDWKSCVPARVPRVRIPLSPLRLRFAQSRSERGRSSGECSPFGLAFGDESLSLRCDFASLSLAPSEGVRAANARPSGSRLATNPSLSAATSLRSVSLRARAFERRMLALRARVWRRIPLSPLRLRFAQSRSERGRSSGECSPFGLAFGDESLSLRCDFASLSLAPSEGVRAANARPSGSRLATN